MQQEDGNEREKVSKKDQKAKKLDGEKNQKPKRGKK
jgi:hypothetical protein